jgi:hypothetical protein
MSKPTATRSILIGVGMATAAATAATAYFYWSRPSTWSHAGKNQDQKEPLVPSTTPSTTPTETKSLFTLSDAASVRMTPQDRFLWSSDSVLVQHNLISGVIVEHTFETKNGTVSSVILDGGGDGRVTTTRGTVITAHSDDTVEVLSRRDKTISTLVEATVFSGSIIWDSLNSQVWLSDGTRVDAPSISDGGIPTACLEHEGTLITLTPDNLVIGDVTFKTSGVATGLSWKDSSTLVCHMPHINEETLVVATIEGISFVFGPVRPAPGPLNQVFNPSRTHYVVFGQDVLTWPPPVTIVGPRWLFIPSQRSTDPALVRLVQTGGFMLQPAKAKPLFTICLSPEWSNTEYHVLNPLWQFVVRTMRGKLIEDDQNTDFVVSIRGLDPNSIQIEHPQDHTVLDVQLDTTRPEAHCQAIVQFITEKVKEF